MKRIVVAAGTRFGRLVVMAIAPSRNEEGYFLCQCDCGTSTEVRWQNLRRGMTQSCGCLKRERLAAEMAKRKARAVSHLPEFKAWIAMRDRCTRAKNPEFHNYGGRGITVCDEWMHSFSAFFAHMGYRPSERHSLDRIDVNGHYAPGNVRWATTTVQAANKRRVRILLFRGESLPLNVWAKRSGIQQGTLQRRIAELGWDVERALTTPTDSYHRRGSTH